MGGGSKEIKQNKQTKSISYTQKYGDYQRERGWWEVEEGMGGYMGDKKRLDSVW